MTAKRKTRIAYYEGAIDALEQHLKTTESGLRSLTDVSADKIDELVAAVRKDHKKLVAKISQRAAVEQRGGA